MSQIQTTSQVADVALKSLLESISDSHVGQFISAQQEDSMDPGCSIVTISFENKNPAYPGWYWAVSVASLGTDDDLTVSEINLLPGAQALVPEAWRPWSARIEPGDLGVGDLLAPAPDDARLTAGFTQVDVEDSELYNLHPAQWELGIGREQILSVTGLESAVERWWDGQTGPRAAMAKAAPASCGSCGFLVPLGGSLGQAFGLCGNEYGAADGHIVAMAFGCGAHSSVRLDDVAPVPVVSLVIDDESDELDDASQLPDFVAEAQREEAELDFLDHLDEDSEFESDLLTTQNATISEEEIHEVGLSVIDLEAPADGDVDYLDRDYEGKNE